MELTTGQLVCQTLTDNNSTYTVQAESVLAALVADDSTLLADGWRLATSYMGTNVLVRLSMDEPRWATAWSTFVHPVDIASVTSEAGTYDGNPAVVLGLGELWSGRRPIVRHDALTHSD